MVFKSENTLPEHYETDFICDLKKDKRLYLWMNILAIVAVVPVIIAYILVLKYTTKTLDFDIYEVYRWKLWAVIVGMLLYIVVHELIHAVFFKMSTKEKVKFGFHGLMVSASVPYIYFYKKAYLVAGLAPAVIMSFVFIVPMFFLNDFDLLIMVTMFTVHFSGCVGDFYIAWKLWKYPDDTLVQDIGTAMTFFIRK